MPLYLFHDGAANLARSCATLAFADAVMVEHTTATQAVRGFAILVAAFLHVFPQGHHLRTELGLAVGPILTF